MSEQREPLPEWLTEIEAILIESGMLGVARWREVLELCKAQRQALQVYRYWGIPTKTERVILEKAERLWEGK